MVWYFSHIHYIFSLHALPALLQNLDYNAKLCPGHQFEMKTITSLKTNGQKVPLK